MRLFKRNSALALIGFVAIVSSTVAGSVGLASAGAATVHSVGYQVGATFTGPITTGHIIEPVSAVNPSLSTYGYEEQEYFASGTANAYKATSMPSNGKWTIKPSSSAFYRTRILVRRPQNPADFNGTVVVEWMNVSFAEAAPDWDYLNPSLMQAGDAYVAVTTQSLAVNGGTGIVATTKSTGLKAAEPARYGTLVHPGDQYALDMFDQIGKGLGGAGVSVLGGLHPKHIVAVGESQSAFYLTTFADTLQPLSHTFDGIFIHSRGGSGAPLSGSSITSKKSQAGPSNLRIRSDLTVPVFMFETQTDLIELGYAPAQQPNTKRIRTWEVAGTSHADTYEVGAEAPALGCKAPINSGPQHNVVQAAFAAFTAWVDKGTPPPSPPPFNLSHTKPAVLALDKNGNVIGGVRTPAVDVPVSTLSGAAPAHSTVICSLFGSTTAFSPSKLVALYQTKSNYLAQYTASLDKAIAGGYILPADRTELLAQAEAVQFPS